jgi:Flp pilus assembly protein TadG
MTAAWRQSDRGSATAEMTVLTPLLVLLLVFVAVVVHRGVSARLRLDTVAHQAARAASMEHSALSAESIARSTATTGLAEAGLVCESLHINTTTYGLTPGSTVAVTVACSVDLTDALLPGIRPAPLSATAVELVDAWRSTERWAS